MCHSSCPPKPPSPTLRRRRPNFGRSERIDAASFATVVLLFVLVVLSLCGTLPSVIDGVDAYPAAPSSVQDNYLSEPIAAGSNYRSFRLNTTFSDTGILSTSTLLMNLTVSARSAVSYVVGYDKVGTIVDFRGNMYKLRSTYSTGVAMDMAKNAYDVGFKVGVPNQAMRNYNSLIEVVKQKNLSVETNFLCRVQLPYLCCNDLPSNLTHRYYTAVVSDVPPITCMVPDDATPPDLLGDYGSSISFSTFLAETNKAILAPSFRTATQASITSINDKKKITSSIASDFLEVIFRRVQSSSAMCTRGLFSDANNIPFFIDTTAFGNGLRQVGITVDDYLAKRGCNEEPLGWPISFSTNMSDNFENFMKVKSFGSSSPNQFACEWRGMYTEGTLTSSPQIRLYCPHDTALTLVFSVTVPTTAFQPLFPFVKLMGSTGIWDERLQRFRVSIQLWSANENDAVVTTTVTQCFLRFGTPATYGPYTQSDKTIKAGHVDRIHFMIKGVQLPVNTPLYQVIGYCVVRVSVAGVLDQYAMFPELKAINVSIASLSTNPNKKFTIPVADKLSPTRVWQRRYLGSPVSPKDAQIRQYITPGIVPAQVNRRREHLRSRYRSEPLRKLLSLNGVAAASLLPDRSPKTLVAPSNDVSPPNLTTIANNISGFQNPNLWAWGSVAQRNRFISGIDRSDVVVYPSPSYLYPFGSDPYLNEDGTYKKKETADHIAELPLYGDGHRTTTTPTGGPSNPNGGNDTSGRVDVDESSSSSGKAASAILFSLGILLLVAAIAVFVLSAAFYWIMRRRRMIIAQFMEVDEKAPKRLRRLLKQRRKELRQQRREAAIHDKGARLSANTSAEGTLENAYNPHTELGKEGVVGGGGDTSSDVSSSESDPDNDTLNIQPVVCGTDSRVHATGEDDTSMLLEGRVDNGKLAIQQ